MSNMGDRVVFCKELRTAKLMLPLIAPAATYTCTQCKTPLITITINCSGAGIWHNGLVEEGVVFILMMSEVPQRSTVLVTMPSNPKRPYISDGIMDEWKVCDAGYGNIASLSNHARWCNYWWWMNIYKDELTYEWEDFHYIARKDKCKKEKNRSRRLLNEPKDIQKMKQEPDTFSLLFEGEKVGRKQETGEQDKL